MTTEKQLKKLEQLAEINGNHDIQGQLDALHRVQAVIEFDLDGIIITANENFLGAMGYSLEEIKGKHHRMFCDGAYTETQDYL